MNIRDIDLNLLVALDVLMQERSVSRAAGRMGITQSAMSNVLRRLRSALDDDLLVRSGHGMRPTARAIELEGPVRHALTVIEGALGPTESFDPSASERRFWIGGRDYMEAIVMPRLTARLLKVAPRVGLRVRSVGLEPPVAEIERGRFDIAIGFFPGNTEHLQQQTLFTEDYLVLARDGHPAIGRRLSLKAYLDAPQLLVAPRGGEIGPVDAALAAEGRSRRIALTVAHFLAAPLIVAETDLISTMPARIARRFAADLPLRTHPPPLRLPSVDISMIWHERSHADPAHRWLRSEISSVAAELAAG